MREIFLVVVFVLACHVDATKVQQPEQADAAAGAQEARNALGRACLESDGCPQEVPHQCVYLRAGNPELGYCSPRCAADDDCKQDYTGPESGTPTCFVPDLPQTCSVLCEEDADCPAELRCKITGGPINVCATQ